MRDQIKKAVNKLTAGSGAELKTVSFTHSSSRQNKSVKGKIILGQEHTMQLQLIEIKGYNTKYINHAAKSFLKAALLGDLVVGSIVWTKHGGTLVTQQTYTLKSDSNFYGVGENPYITCDGKEFGRNIKAKFIRNERGSCQPGTGREYQLFEILEL